VAADRPGPPIFVLGVAHRSGSNYLSALVGSHPDAQRVAPLYEDYLVAGSRHLLAYADAAARRWEPFDVGPCERSSLLAAIGDGITSFLERRAAGLRPVAKTPILLGVETFFDVFPRACLLIVLRDGRSTVESAVRSFGSDYESAIEQWAEGARILLRFLANRPSGRWRLVRYEALLTHLDDELREVLDCCELDPRSYDFEAARRLPLQGSSTDRGGSAELHWRSVERPTDFGGLERHAGWSRERHRQFNDRAGELLAALGYEPS
jgi:hypothetical protein